MKESICFGIYVSTYNSEKRYYRRFKSCIHLNIFIGKVQNLVFDFY